MSAGDPNSWRWVRRLAAVPVGFCCRGCLVIANWSTSGHLTTVIRSPGVRQFLRSTCTSTPITSISAQSRRLTLTPISLQFDGKIPNGCSASFLTPGGHDRAQGPSRRLDMRILIPPLFTIAVAISGSATAQEIDWQKVDAVFGRKPAITGDVHRYGFPRTDLSVTLDGVTIKPALALGGWVAFKPVHDGAMVMGDLVLLESEINPVMAKLIEGGLEITAVHNHLLRANPATFYMHLGGHGDPTKMASVIHDALSASKATMSPPAAAASSPAVDLDTARL